MPADPPVNASVALVTSSGERPADLEVHTLAAALRADGLQTDVVSWDGDVDWRAYLLVVVHSTHDYADRLPAFVSWATAVERCTTLVNPADVIRWNSHRGYLDELAAKGVPTVPTRFVPGPSTDVADQVRECPWDDVVLKPAVDIGVRHAWRGRRDDPSLARVGERLARHGDVIVQPVVPAVAGGERSLVFLGGVLSHAMRTVPATGDDHSQRRPGGTETDIVADTTDVRVAQAAIGAAPGRLTYARADIVDWDGTPCLMELEAVEPDLLLRGRPERVARFVATLRAEVARAARTAHEADEADEADEAR